MKPSIFHHWVPIKLRPWLLTLILISLSLNNGISATASGYIAGSLNSIPADVTMASYTQTIGLICGLPLFIRLHLLLPGKAILVPAFLLLMITNLAFSYTDEPLILVMGSFVFGFVRIIALLELLMQLVPILMPKGERYRLYFVYYFIT